MTTKVLFPKCKKVKLRHDLIIRHEWKKKSKKFVMFIMPTTEILVTKLPQNKKKTTPVQNHQNKSEVKNKLKTKTNKISSQNSVGSGSEKNNNPDQFNPKIFPRVEKCSFSWGLESVTRKSIGTFLVQLTLRHFVF